MGRNVSMNKIEVNHTFAENVERERIKLGYTQKEMASKLEMSLGTYKNMISGATTNISLYTAYLVYKLTGCMVYEMLNKELPGYKILEAYKKLSPSQQRLLLAVADFECEFRPESSGEDYITVLEPTGDLHDGMIWDSFSLSTVEVSAYRRKFHFDAGIKVTSNHLHPTYISGDVLLIALQPPRDGDVGVFINRNTNRAYLRIFKQTDPVQLRPINNYGQTFFINPKSESEMSEWIKFGVVVSKVR